MTEPFDPKTIEPKWQRRWEESRAFRAAEDPAKPKLYILDMFPYPSAAGLHVGHPEGYTATAILSRLKRMQAFNVLHPMGWDAFGLPAENHAIATGQHPRAVTQANVANFRRQIKALGFSYDWDREIDTTDPAYYQWTQWIFLQLFKRGLAVEGVAPINFCPSCKTGLANEEVHQGACERCGTAVERRNLRQWILKITAYADRLLSDLAGLDWPESTLAMQRNWIGRSEGAEVKFTGASPTAAVGKAMTVFTTRPDTLFGATYMVLAPEHPDVDAFTTPDRKTAVDAYRQAARHKSDLERTDLAKDKTGVFTGGTVTNPVNGEKIPVWVADYVLISYGTGAIMAVPAHDQRDFEFARKFEIPIRVVVAPARAGPPLPETMKEAFDIEGVAVNSGAFDGLTTAEFRRKITAWLAERGAGRAAVNYRLRDWVFSRQRYWGEPIPIVHCARCGAVPVPEDQLPVRLPEVQKYEPTGTGESPLAAVESWVQTTCPTCGAAARRETNTMPQWAGSCWYYLRYLDPRNAQAAWSAAAERFWMGTTGVDLYVGGAEHAVLHLLYSRFWHKVLFDLGLVSTKEPFQKLRHQGMILSYSYRDALGAYHGYDEIDFAGAAPKLKATGEVLTELKEKMSKSKKNVISPDDVIGPHGADAMRLYEMFMGDFEAEKPWDMRTVEGVTRFLQKAWRALDAATAAGDPHARLRHRTIRAVTERVENFKFNTAISALMEYVNALAGGATAADRETLALLLCPFAPHLAEEMWERLGKKSLASLAPWPRHDPSLVTEDRVEIPVQINGKLKDRLTVAVNAPPAEVLAAARALPKIRESLQSQKVIKEIHVPGRMVSFVTAPINGNGGDK
ncbi:MAG: leucine--tRNA ligase [Elusimicrobia bacterium]|nr:leucine--tRNA ligase [Elusimicrobiota bacterium]